jgi:hypothetical protein
MGRMALLESVTVLAVVGVVIYALISLATSAGQPRAIPRAGGRWQVTHYEAAGATRVVLQKVLPDGATVLDEHLVATVPTGDPDYDSRFLEAMAQARARLALFLSEE